LRIEHLSCDQINYFLSNDSEEVGKGAFGLLKKYDESTLIKLYYKIFLQSYHNLNSKTFDGIKSWHVRHDVLRLFTCSLDHLQQLYESLQKTESSSLIKGVVLYDESLIAVLLEHYVGYENLGKVFSHLYEYERLFVLERAKFLIDDLMDNNIFPSDIQENNIVINPKNLDVKIIDLDGRDVRLVNDEYLEKHPDFRSKCFERYHHMEKKLLKKIN